MHSASCFLQARLSSLRRGKKTEGDHKDHPRSDWAMGIAGYLAILAQSGGQGSFDFCFPSPFTSRASAIAMPAVVKRSAKTEVSASNANILCRNGRTTAGSSFSARRLLRLTKNRSLPEMPPRAPLGGIRQAALRRVRRRPNPGIRRLPQRGLLGLPRRFTQLPQRQWRWLQSSRLLLSTLIVAKGSPSLLR